MTWRNGSWRKSSGIPAVAADRSSEKSRIAPLATRNSSRSASVMNGFQTSKIRMARLVARSRPRGRSYRRRPRRCRHPGSCSTNAEAASRRDHQRQMDDQRELVTPTRPGIRCAAQHREERLSPGTRYVETRGGATADRSCEGTATGAARRPCLRATGNRRSSGSTVERRRVCRAAGSRHAGGKP